jgi:SnoaL-like domain
MTELAQRYLACWNETDAATRRELIEQTWCDDATYVDPLAQAQGWPAIDATIAAVQGQFPDFVFTSVGPVDAHHQQARFQWGLGPAGADPIVVGFDVVVTADDGRIRSVIGFLDQVPA